MNDALYNILSSIKSTRKVIIKSEYYESLNFWGFLVNLENFILNIFVKSRELN